MFLIITQAEHQEADNHEVSSLPTVLSGEVPNKSKHTGEIFDVEPGEAEWSLETLDGLFDFFFVQPAKLKEKREALNKKLQEAGKPEMR